MKHKAIILFQADKNGIKEAKERLECMLGEVGGIVLEYIKPERCPYSAIRAAYNEAFKGHAVTQISEKGLKSGSQRAKKLKARWEDYNTLEWWIEYFDFCTESPFLMGKIPPRDGFRQFRLDIDYLINEAKLNLIMEGKYHG